MTSDQDDGTNHQRFRIRAPDRMGTCCEPSASGRHRDRSSPSNDASYSAKRITIRNGAMAQRRIVLHRRISLSEFGVCRATALRPRCGHRAMRRDRASTPFAMTIVIAMQSIFSCSGVFLLNQRMHYESESCRLSIASVQDIVRCFCVLAGAYLGGVRWAA